MAQFVSITLTTACQYFLIAISFAVIYWSARFFHLAHAAICTTGAYVCLLFLSRSSGWVPFFHQAGLVVAIIIAGFIGSLVGLLTFEVVYKRMWQVRSTPLQFLVASFGLLVAIESVIGLFFGVQIRSLPTAALREPFVFGGAIITGTQILAVILSVFLGTTLAIALRVTKIGLAARAVADDPFLAKISGINTLRILRWSFVVGSFIGSVGGIIIAIDTNMRPSMGFGLLLKGVVAMFLVDSDSVKGVAFGAILLALIENAALTVIPSLWKETITLVLLICILVIKSPSGFSLAKERGV